MEKFVFVSPLGAAPGVTLAIKAAWASFAPSLRVINHQLVGLGGGEGNYRRAEAELLGLSKEAELANPEGNGQLVLSGWSLGAVIALRFTVDHPELVKRLLLIAGPLSGSWASRLVPFIPGPWDLRPGSPILRALAQKLANMTVPLPPTYVFIAAEDGIIDASAASLPLVQNAVYYVFGMYAPTRLRADLRLSWVWTLGVNHVTIALHPAVLPIIGRAMRGDTFPIIAQLGV
jgi:pimeloyl-ACP methyl ester carboxylesterase